MRLWELAARFLLCLTAQRLFLCLFSPFPVDSLVGFLRFDRSRGLPPCFLSDSGVLPATPPAQSVMQRFAQSSCQYTCALSTALWGKRARYSSEGDTDSVGQAWLGKQ